MVDRLARLDRLERRYDGPIPDDALAGGALCHDIADARSRFRSLTGLARRQLAVIRKLRDNDGGDVKRRVLLGDLRFYLDHRRYWRGELRRLLEVRSETNTTSGQWPDAAVDPAIAEDGP
ncbi:MAG: hypothetical protein QF926_06780 [Alphaproteobacteria bacterium]|jgi:hypothetical protein|nr:hypothetical protein [Alphaproteobacteria bacterium]